MIDIFGLANVQEFDDFTCSSFVEKMENPFIPRKRNFYPGI